MTSLEPIILPAAFITALQDCLRPAQILQEQEQTRVYACDGLSAYIQTPPVVVLPESEQDVINILKICQQHQIPIVPRGAGTGLSGGALPLHNGIVVTTVRMNRILSIDEVHRRGTVQPGVRNLAISDAVSARGLYYAPDPSSQIACTIGGNVAENSGGVHCLKYGLTIHNIEALRLVTIDGEVLVFDRAMGEDGLDLLALVIGSEGMLGIVTEVTVQLTPKPQVAQVIMASFPSVNLAAQAVSSLIASGLIPAGLEMMDQTSTRMVEPFVKAGYDTDAAAILLCESDGSAVEVSNEITLMSALLMRSGATRLTVSDNEAERQRFWSGRKNAFPAAGRISPDYYCMDGTIPRHQIGAVLEQIEKMTQKYGLGCANVFHAGDGNLHPLILFNASITGEFERAEDFGTEILELCISAGGTITGEHGVGVEKLGPMCTQFSNEERDIFFALKKSFDPLSLLNPNKAIPTLSRCFEHGRRHHSADTPSTSRHQDLPRF